MENNQENFFQKMIEKLSILNEDMSKSDFLEEICRFFDISHAFIYEYDGRGKFARKEFFAKVQSGLLSRKFDIKNLLGLEDFSTLCTQKVILCTGFEEKSEFKQKLLDIFGLGTLVFIPILNQRFELVGFVGLGDRRKQSRHAKAEIDKACSLLTLLSNMVKLEMFKKNIENAEATLSNVLDHVGIDIYVNDYYTYDVLYANKSMAEPYGGVENMLGKKCWEAIYVDKEAPCDFCPQPKLLDENGNLNKTYQWDYQRQIDKEWFRVLSSSFPWTDGRIAHLIASVNITESKRSQLLIEKLALFDYLTGLPNRRAMHDDVQAFIADSQKFGKSWYMLFCDLDGFKNINDTLGHEAGDVLLKGIAKDLSDICSDELRAYRQGGDEFVVLLKEQDSKESIKKIINKLFEIFRKTYDYEGAQMSCGCSIGIANYPKDASTSKEIFHLADTAMYRVKKEGRGTARFCKDGDFLEMDEYFNENK